jgi:outer membrane protein assembly factor BamB
MLDRRLLLRMGSALAVTGCCRFETQSRADDWLQWRGNHRDGIWREQGLRETLPIGQLPLKWSVDVGPGYSGPVVADGKVFLTDKLDQPARERIVCFQESDGQLLWQHDYPSIYKIGYSAGPRASISVHGETAYALGAMGHLHALQTSSGKVLWQRDLNADYEIAMPIWGISSSPLVYEELVIVHIGAANGASVVALDRQSGEEVWRSLNDRAQYSAPIMIRQSQQDVMVIWTGDNVAGLDPKTGKVFWQIPFVPIKMPIGVPTPIIEGDRLFVSSFYDGSMMLRVPSDKLIAEKLWSLRGQDEKTTLALHSMIGTPVFRNGHIYGVDSYGQFRCLDANDGSRLWEDKTVTNQERWGTVHMVENGKKTWIFNELGELILAELTPEGFRQFGRSKLIDPTTAQLSRRGNRGVCWAHPAFANRHIFARSDEKLVCASLAMEG